MELASRGLQECAEGRESSALWMSPYCPAPLAPRVFLPRFPCARSFRDRLLPPWAPLSWDFLPISGTQSAHPPPLPLACLSPVFDRDIGSSLAAASGSFQLRDSCRHLARSFAAWAGPQPTCCALGLFATPDPWSKGEESRAQGTDLRTSKSCLSPALVYEKQSPTTNKRSHPQKCVCVYTRIYVYIYTEIQHFNLMLLMRARNVK